MALLYGERLEARRRYVRFLLDWRHVLSPKARAVFDLRYNNGLSLAEIGHKLGISSHSVSRNLRQSYRVIERAAKAARKP
jgi:RNA polymerase sigma factor (sigma-70 family)